MQWPMGHSGDDAVHKKKIKKMKTHRPNRLKLLVSQDYFKVLFRTTYKEIDVILVQCPFIQKMTNIFGHTPLNSHIFGKLQKYG